MAFGVFSIFEDIDLLLQTDAHQILLATTMQQIKIAQLHQKSYTLTSHTPWQRLETAFADSERPFLFKQWCFNAPLLLFGSSMSLQSSFLDHVSNNIRVTFFETLAALIPIVSPSSSKKIVPPPSYNKRDRPCKNIVLSKPQPPPQKQKPRLIKTARTINTLGNKKTMDQKIAQEIEATRQVRVSKNAKEKLHRKQNDKIWRHIQQYTWTLKKSHSFSLPLSTIPASLLQSVPDLQYAFRFNGQKFSSCNWCVKCNLVDMPPAVPTLNNKAVLDKH